MPKAHLEVTGGTLRVFNDGYLPEPFDFSCQVIGDEGTALIKGLRMDGSFGLTHLNAMARELARYDFHTMAWRRHKGGRVYPIERPTGLLTSSWRPPSQA